MLTICALASAAFAPAASAQSNPPAAESTEARVDKLFAQFDKKDSPGCALAVVRDGRVVYKRGYGMADLEHDVPMTPHSVVYIGSTSKQFAAASVALLAQQGKLTVRLRSRETPLEGVGEDGFAGQGLIVRFTRAGGRIDGFTLTMPPVRRFSFDKVKS